MKYLFFTPLLMLFACMASCQNQDTTVSTKNPTEVKTQTNTSISVEEFEKKLMQDTSVQLVDVRTPEEFKEGHLKGAVNYNVNGDDFEKQISNLDKNKPVMVYCRSGKRSSSAASVLIKNGFTEVYNMEGGITKWNEANKPVEK